LPNGAQAAQQNVRATSIGFEAKFAAEFSQSKHGFWSPMFPLGEDELSRRLAQIKGTKHMIHVADPQVFHIQALLLIEAIAKFNAAVQTPLNRALPPG
jgi:hypothetical protein